MIFMDKISRCRHVQEIVQFGDSRIACLFFADDVVLLATTHSDLQRAVGQFTNKCEVNAPPNVRLWSSVRKTWTAEWTVGCCPSEGVQISQSHINK